MKAPTKRRSYMLPAATTERMALSGGTLTGTGHFDLVDLVIAADFRT
jgi:hypothetical protein